METVLIVIIIALTILLLAFMAGILNLDIDSGESKFPRIKLHFEKDPNLFSLVRRRAAISQVKDAEGADRLLADDFFGFTKINYGEEAETISRKTMTITALKDGVKDFQYFNTSSDVLVKQIAGFQNLQEGHRRLGDFSTWRGNTRLGGISNLHRIALPIPTLRKDQQLFLDFEVKLKIHYKELIEGNDLIYHDFYYRMETKVNKAILLYELPLGQVSEIHRLAFQNSLGDEILLQKEFTPSANKIININEVFGHGWIKRKNNSYEVGWLIPKPLQRGQVCILQWYTKKKQTV